MKFKKVKNEKEERNLIFVSISSEVFFPFLESHKVCIAHNLSLARHRTPSDFSDNPPSHGNHKIYLTFLNLFSNFNIWKKY